MLSYFSQLLSRIALSLKESKGTDFMQSHEFGKSPSAKMTKQSDFMASSSEPLLCKEKQQQKKKKKEEEEEGSYGIDVVEEKSVIRVKVKMTRQEAARLMSKCKDGGILEFRDVSRELVNIPVNRVSIMSSAACCYGDGMLKTIPEEN